MQEKINKLALLQREYLTSDYPDFMDPNATLARWRMNRIIGELLDAGLSAQSIINRVEYINAATQTELVS